MRTAFSISRLCHNTTHREHFTGSETVKDNRNRLSTNVRRNTSSRLLGCLHYRNAGATPSGEGRFDRRRSWRAAQTLWLSSPEAVKTVGCIHTPAHSIQESPNPHSVLCRGTSFFLHETVDAFIILAIVLVSGLLGFWQERGAKQRCGKVAFHRLSEITMMNLFRVTLRCRTRRIMSRFGKCENARRKGQKAPPWH